MQDDQLSPDERARFAALPRESPPRPDLEDRVVGALRASGALRSGRPIARWLQMAAAAVIFLSGFMVGRLELPATESPLDDTYLLLLYGGEPSTADAEQARVTEYGAWAGELATRGQLVSAARLADASRILGATSPAAEQQPSGFFLIRAGSFAEAEATAAECPHVGYGGTVVVRPLVPAG